MSLISEHLYTLSHSLTHTHTRTHTHAHALTQARSLTRIHERAYTHTLTLSLTLSLSVHLGTRTFEVIYKAIAYADVCWKRAITNGAAKEAMHCIDSAFEMIGLCVSESAHISTHSFTLPHTCTHTHSLSHIQSRPPSVSLCL